MLKSSFHSVALRTYVLCRSNIRPFLGLFALYCVGIFSLLRSNVLYVNDTSRVLERGMFMKDVGRVLSEILGDIFFLPAADISPLTQLAAVACMAASAIFLSAAILRIRRLSCMQALFCLPIALFPYFLQNLSYKFDCVFMALSVLCVSLAAFWVLRNSNTLASHILAFCAFFASLCLYQAMINICVVCMAFLLIREILLTNRPFSAVKAVCSFLPSLIAALVFYKLLLIFVPLNAYTLQHSGMLSVSGMLQGITDNCASYISYVTEDWAGNRMGYALCAMAALFTVTQAAVAFTRRTGAFANLCRFLASVCVSVLCVLFLPGLMLLLKNMVLEPRVFAVIGIFLALVLLFCHKYAYGLLRAAVSVCGLYIGCLCLTFAAAYGNALAMQKDFEQMLFSNLSREMQAYSEEFRTNRVRYAGFMPRSPQLAKFEEDFPAVKKLVPVSMRNGDWHTPRKLAAWGVDTERMLPAEVKDMNPRLLHHTAFYDIGINSESILFLTFPFGKQDGTGR